MKFYVQLFVMVIFAFVIMAGGFYVYENPSMDGLLVYILAMLAWSGIAIRLSRE